MQRDTIVTFLKNIQEPASDSMSDPDLLRLVRDSNDEAAFRQLMQRHGPMVLGVCRRILWCPQDVEDAFQATFLVLFRKAATLAHCELLGNWLYGVAYRTALEARKKSALRHRKEGEAAGMQTAETFDEQSWEDVQPLLDRELTRLSDKYREAIVLCDVQGLPRKDVAEQLGVPEGTLSSRLARARELLRQRLQLRGVSLSLTALVTGLTTAASAQVPAQLLHAAVENFTSLAVTGQAVPHTLTLTDGVLRTMLLSRWKTTLSVVALVLVVFASGLGWFWYAQSHAQPGAPLATSNANQPVQPKPIALPKDGNTPVLTYDVEGGFFRRVQQKPYLTIFANGQIVACDPHSKSPGIKGKLNAKELQALLRFVVQKQNLLNLKSEDIKNAILAQQPGRRLLGPEVDASATVIRLRLANRFQELKLYALEVYAKKYTDIKTLQQFDAVRQRLHHLRMVTFAGGRAKVREALAAANKAIKKRNAKSPQLREQDLLTAATRKNGEFSVVFRRTFPNRKHILATVQWRQGNYGVTIQSSFKNK